jgi:hypothetical protein
LSPFTTAKELSARELVAAVALDFELDLGPANVVDVVVAVAFAAVAATPVLATPVVVDDA